MSFIQMFFGVDAPEESFQKEKNLIDFELLLPNMFSKDDTKHSIKFIFTFSKLVSQIMDDLEEGQTKVIHSNTQGYHLEIQKKYGEIRVIDFDQWEV
ncbi:hypothetical protein NVP1170O_104 [Vibrio phage 1.170.O._10N.261.52.C3]|nr:hypothetical protein NVP1170O_104 [Vibrio phage 1.170.O._10N.261.52.C3]